MIGMADTDARLAVAFAVYCGFSLALMTLMSVALKWSRKRDGE